MKDTTKRSPTSDSAPSRRKEKHVSRACNGCRRRKSKCDGVQPVCGTCAAQKHECSWTTEEDGRRPATKAQVDAMGMEIRTLKDERDRQSAQIDRLRDRLRALGHDPDAATPPPLSITIPHTHSHQRAHSEGGGAGPQYLGIPSPISFGAHSPVSVASSLPSPMPAGSQFLTVPGFGPSRGPSPSPEPSVYGSSTDDDEPRSASVLSDSDNDAPMAPFVATRKRLFTFGEGPDEDVIALTGSSPLALSCSPPRTPARSRASSFRSDAGAGASGLGAFRFPPSPAASSPSSPPHPHHQQHPQQPEPEHDEHCPCDWAQHLPPAVAAALPRAEHDALLADYFAHVAAWGLRVVPRLFLRDMRACLSQPHSPSHQAQWKHYSPALHNAVLADAAQLAAPASALASPETRDALARHARDLAEAECAGRAVIPAVAALAVLAQYHLARERGARLAFAVLGMAVRVALSAGLNIDARDVVVDDQARWDREWCYWSLFVQDVDISLHVGQELTMPLPRFDARSLASSPALASASPGEAHLVGETFVHACALMAIAAQVMQLLARTEPPPASGVSALQTELARWHADLPDALQIHRASTSSAPPHVLVMHMALNWITILLHRPFYAGNAARDESRKFLDDACTKLLRTLGTFERLYGFRAAPLALVQIAFVGGAAALLRAEGLHAGANKRRQEAIALAHQARDALRAMSVGAGCARGYADALERRAGVVASHVHVQSHSRTSSVASPVRNTTASSSGSITTPPMLGHAHSHSVPAVVVQDANNGAALAVAPPPAALDPLFNPFGGPGDLWAFQPFDLAGGGDPMLGVQPPHGGDLPMPMLGLSANPDAGAGVALFGAGGGHDVFMQQQPDDGGALFLQAAHSHGHGQDQHDPFLQQPQQEQRDVFLQHHQQQQQQPWPWPPQQQ